MLEKDIVMSIMRYLRALPHCFCFKTHGGMYSAAGIPDILCCHNGIFYAFEVKTPAGRVTPLQESTIQKIRAAGGNAYVVRSVAEVRDILKES